MVKKLIFFAVVSFVTPAYAADTLITSWATSHGWAKAYGDATLTDDTTTSYTGAQSLKIVTGGTSTASAIRKSSISPALDLTSKHLKLILKSPDWSKLANLSLMVTSNGWTDYYDISLKSYVALQAVDEWVVVTLPWSTATLSGGGNPTKNAVSAMQIFVNDAGSAATLYAGALYSVDNSSAGYVTFDFDDTHTTHYSVAAPKLAEYGYHGTFHAITDWWDGNANWVTTTEGVALQNTYGSAMGLHGGDSWRDDLTIPQLLSFVDRIILKYQELGLTQPLTYGAYPYGETSEAVADALRSKGLKYVRTVINTGETIPPSNRMFLRHITVSSDTTTAYIKGRIDTGIANKEWVIVTFHKLLSPATESDQYTPVQYDEIVDYVHTQGYTTKTFPEMMGIIAAAENTPSTYYHRLCSDAHAANATTDFTQSLRCQRW